MIDAITAQKIELLRQTTENIQRDFIEKLRDYGNNWSLALQLLNEGAAQSKSRHALAVFTQLNFLQRNNVKRMVGLLEKLNEFHILLENSKRVELLLEVPSFTKKIDLSKIADEEDLLKLNNFLFSKIDENSILKLQYHTAIPTICVYYLLEFDNSILLTFLNKPTVRSHMLDHAIFVAKEVAKPILDFSFGCPFTSIVDTVIKLSRSFIDDESRKMSICIDMLDRLFFLSDHCKVLNNSISSTETLMTESLTSLREEESNFVENFYLLKSLWSGANK